MDYICYCPPAGLRDALANLPATLDETYTRTLREIKEAKWKYAHRILRFVAVASRPLRVKEVAELFAFDFKAGLIPRFREDWRLKDPADAVLSACSTLLSVVDGGYGWGNVIQFSHFSVKEFLTSTRLAKVTDTIPCRYHISMTPAHTLAAQCCLGILLHLNKDVITHDSLEDFPLAEYAAEHWVDHAQFEDVSRNVEDGIKQLFDPSKPHLEACVWIYDPGVPRWRQEERGERPLPLSQTSLHVAASWGLYSTVEWLIIELLENVHSQRSTDNATPLHLASQSGKVDVARMLIERGADLTAQSKDGETALHLASRTGKVDIAHMLIERGVDPTAQNKDGQTPLHLVSTNPFNRLPGRTRYLEFARILLTHGADVNAKNMNGLTPLHLASQRGLTEVMRVLVEHGADSG